MQYLLRKSTLFAKLQGSIPKQKISSPFRSFSFYINPRSASRLGRRNFSSSANGSTHTDDVTYTVAEEILYKPKSPIPFKNGVAEVFVSDDAENRLFPFMFYLLFGGITYYSVKKLYYYKERSYFGIVWYALLCLAAARGLYKTVSITKVIIRKILLCEDGKHIYIETLGPLLTLQRRMVYIANISRPVSAYGNIGGIGFPILADGQMVVIPRFGTKVLPELMPVILNGKFIDTTNAHFETDI